MTLKELSEVFDILSKHESMIDRKFPSIQYHKVSQLLKSAKSMDISGDRVTIDDITIGPGCSDIIKDIQNTGESAKYDLAKAFMENVSDTESASISSISGIGDTKSEILESHGIRTISDLVNLDPKVGDEILNTGIRFTQMMDSGLRMILRTKGKRLSLKDATAIHSKIENRLLSLGIKSIVAGSLRRQKSTIGDLDLIVLVNESNRSKIIESCKTIYDELIVSGDRKISGIIDNFQVDIRFIRKEEFGCHLLHATGPANFNQRIRAYAKSIGFKLNEYCLTNLNVDPNIEMYFESEEEVFKALGIDYLPPKDRE